MDPFYSGIPRDARERRLVETPRRALQPEESTSKPDQTFRDLAKTANKALELLKAIEPVAAAYSVPVAPTATNIRAAVKRRDATSIDGSEIRFDLFKDAIEQIDARRRAVKIDFLNGLTGNPEADDSRIRQMFAGVDNPDLAKHLLPLIFSEVLLLYFLNQLLGPYQAVNTQGAVAAKQPPGTETPSILQQTIVGIAAQALIYGIEEQTMALMLQQCGCPFDPQLVIEQARARPRDTLQDLIVARVGESDYESILRYSLEYIANNPKPGYDLWLGYLDARRIHTEAVMTWQVAPAYSVQDAYHRHGVDGQLNVDPGLLAAIQAAIAPVETQYVVLARNKADLLADHLDIVAQVLSSRWSQEAICCAAMFVHNLGTKWIRCARALLNILLATQAPILSLSLQTLLSNLLSLLNARIQEELLHLLNRLYGQAVGLVLDPISDVEDEEWETLFRCPLVRTAIDAILAAIEALTLKISGIINDLGQHLSIDGDVFVDRWEVIHTRRQIQGLMEVLDAMLAAVESGILCSSPDSPDFETELGEVTTALPGLPHISLDAAVIREYFSDTKPLQTSGKTPGTIKTTIPDLNDPVLRVGDPLDPKSVATPHCHEIFGSILESLGRPKS